MTSTQFLMVNPLYDMSASFTDASTNIDYQANASRNFINLIGDISNVDVSNTLYDGKTYDPSLSLVQFVKKTKRNFLDSNTNTTLDNLLYWARNTSGPNKFPILETGTSGESTVVEIPFYETITGYNLIDDILTGPGEHTGSGTRFGWSTALSGDGKIMAVGATRGDGNTTSEGNVQVYVLNNNKWDLREVLKGYIQWDQFGWTLALSNDGNILVTTILYHDAVNNVLRGGVVHVYEWNGTTYNKNGINATWSESSALYVHNGTGTDDHLGRTLALSGDGTVLAMGCRTGDNGVNANGRVIILKRDNNNYVHRYTTEQGNETNSSLGQSLAMSNDGNIIAIGTGLYDIVKVLIWDPLNNIYTVRWSGTKGDIEHYGYSLALNDDGNVLAIGNKYNKYNNAINSDPNVYDWNPNTNNYEKRISNTVYNVANNNSDDVLSVALNSDGNIITLSSTSGSNDIYVLAWNGTSWATLLNDSNSGGSNLFGNRTLSISSKGDIIVYGSPFYSNGILHTYIATTTDDL